MSSDIQRILPNTNAEVISLVEVASIVL